jgi:tripartite-type tricarboxylate transporter receptor subunit TctC
MNTRVAAGLLIAMMSFGVQAQGDAAADYPSKPIRILIGFTPGGGPDITARHIAQRLSENWKQQVLVEHRPGAGGTIAAGIVARAAPDGYTLLSVSASHAIAAAIYSKLPYDTLNDLIPVLPLGQQPLVVVTAPSKYKTLGDLVAAGKAKPDALNYSTAGVGSASHFGAERIRASAGFKAQHIPFKGAAEAVTEVVAGRIDFSVQLFSTTISLLRDGKLAALAVSAEKRGSVMPEVPTTIEAGLPPDSVYPFYSALYLPANTPRDIVDKLYRETAKALQAPPVQARFAALGVEPMPMTHEQFGKFFKDDVAGNVALVKAANIPTQ